MAKLVKDDRTGVIHYLRTAGETYADKFAIACTSRPLSMVCEPYADETGPTCKRCLALKRE